MGPGVTTWLGDSDVYASVSAGLMRGREQGFVGTAAAITLGLGKTWWTGDRTTVGGVLRLSAFGVDVDGDGLEALGVTAGLRLSFTFN